jgi:hypothetical protein
MYMGERFLDCNDGERFTTRDSALSPSEQISLHLRCLVREHKFDRLAWHLSGIRRALWFSSGLSSIVKTVTNEASFLNPQMAQIDADGEKDKQAARLLTAAEALVPRALR